MTLPLTTIHSRGELTPLGGWLYRVEHFLRRYVVLSDDQATAIVLWAAHTYAFLAAAVTPYLSITSAEKRSGKTRLLEVLVLVVARPWFTGRASAAVLARKVDAVQPTLLLDESDAAFNGDKEYTEVLRGILNDGYRRGGAVSVCVGQGANLSYKDFATFCPKAIAGIGKLPDTVGDRSIPVRLKRRTAAESVERFRQREARAIGESLADALESCFDEETVAQLTIAKPELPDALNDRAQDVWEPLLAIADLAGGDWSQRARDGAVRLNGEREPEDDTIGVRLLGDCRRAFADLRVDRIPGEQLREYLHGLDEAPWGDWYGRPISARKLSDLLRVYEVRTRSIRLDAGTRKGYLREQFNDAWARYLPSETAQRHNGSTKPETGTFDPAQHPVCAASEKAEKPHEQAVVPGVPDTDGENGRRQLTEAEYVERFRARAGEA